MKSSEQLDVCVCQQSEGVDFNGSSKQMPLKPLGVKPEGKGRERAPRCSNIRGTGGACQGDPKGMAKTQECMDVKPQGTSI